MTTSNNHAIAITSDSTGQQLKHITRDSSLIPVGTDPNLAEYYSVSYVLPDNLDHLVELQAEEAIDRLCYLVPEGSISWQEFCDRVIEHSKDPRHEHCTPKYAELLAHDLVTHVHKVLVAELSTATD